MDAVLDDMKKACLHLIKGLSSCAQSIAVSVDDIQAIVPVEPLGMSHGSQSLHSGHLMPKPKSGVGLPDDPEELIEDVLFRSQFLDMKGASRFARLPFKTDANECEWMKMAVPPCSAGPASKAVVDTEQPVPIWQRLIVHRISVEVPFDAVVVKSTTATQMMEIVRPNEAVSVWICPVSEASDNIVLEVRARPQPTQSATSATSAGNSACIIDVDWNLCSPGRLIGVATLTVKPTADCSGLLLDGVSRPVIDVFTGQRRGTMELSLVTEPRRTHERHHDMMNPPAHQSSGQPIRFQILTVTTPRRVEFHHPEIFTVLHPFLKISIAKIDHISICWVESRPTFRFLFLFLFLFFLSSRF